MYRIKIYSLGKTKEHWLQEALTEYEKRLSPSLEISWMLAKTEKQLQELCAKEQSLIALTPKAQQLTSEDFSSSLYQWLEDHGCRLAFLIGGAEGIPQETLQKAYKTLSFSSMTFTHQIARLLLLEQLYRASEIHRGSCYHK
ncbi:MAG: 23S rRNA (pseudouridine(1915)-N(3))-methyltransferase RlmH [Chlamydiae bacterium]|nr:23S rRNA (pseudouridine(1915)-N(3))-methyltransferase RlmH [Chlamydiota bacterium]